MASAGVNNSLTPGPFTDRDGPRVPERLGPAEWAQLSLRLGEFNLLPSILIYFRANDSLDVVMYDALSGTKKNEL